MFTAITSQPGLCGGEEEEEEEEEAPEGQISAGAAARSARGVSFINDGTPFAMRSKALGTQRGM